MKPKLAPRELSNMEEFRKKELEKNFAQERKMSSKISTCIDELSTYITFKEKKIEAYCKDHDHSYAKNIITDQANSITIDFVNDDCLAAIFKYVPACERPKIALVCQKWKRALDLSWFNVKKLELTHWEYDENPTCLIKYPTLDGQLSFLKSLLFKCGRYLTKLDLSAYGHCNIVPVINEYCPNLVKLRLRFTYVDKIILYDAFSRLSKLKVLAIIFQDFKDTFIPITLIYSLLKVADTLTDLILLNWKDNLYNPCYFPEDTICVLRKLRANLKRFEISGIQLSNEMTHYLMTNVIPFFSNHDFYKNYKTEEFKNIKDLDMGEYLISDDGLYSIANTMKQLKELRTYCHKITNDGIVTISKMNLLILDIAGLNLVIDSSSIKLLKNLRVARFPQSNNITDELAMEVLNNSPEMEMLYVLNTRVTVEFIKKAAEISRRRKRHLNLGVSFMCDKKQYESPYFTITIQKN
ncbi:uncharacterized protein LOC122855690 [Aphidius gifuensis]|uniref:uncharacterized protein LOC122855690 n=1 Tax=Aphidius gifuensis TaxID=684658 RepID=UPI001CDCA4DF|nr:uncharacterized protein LOC122855690 [Aphidius gifuensis]